MPNTGETPVPSIIVEVMLIFMHTAGTKYVIDYTNVLQELSSVQPAIDAFQLALMRQFNRLPETRRWSLWSSNSPSTLSVRPLVYGTYQAYLRRSVLPTFPIAQH